jgi:protease I
VFRGEQAVTVICHGPGYSPMPASETVEHSPRGPASRPTYATQGLSGSTKKVRVDGRLVSSRKPADIPAFNRELVRIFAETSVFRTHPA